jgi:hypothetical protein
MVKTRFGIEVTRQQHSRSLDVSNSFFLSKNPILPLAGTYVDESGDFNRVRG